MRLGVWKVLRRCGDGTCFYLKQAKLRCRQPKNMMLMMLRVTEKLWTKFHQSYAYTKLQLHVSKHSFFDSIFNSPGVTKRALIWAFYSFNDSCFNPDIDSFLVSRIRLLNTSGIVSKMSVIVETMAKIHMIWINDTSNFKQNSIHLIILILKNHW
jgi:hypothetical protein